MSEKNYYITTPLYYVNAKPHIGHAYTNILCDVFSRFKRMTGENVFFLTGTDEHGTKIEKAAKEKGETPQAYVDAIVPSFKSLWSLLGIRYDYFIRTTDQGHKEIVRSILLDLEKKGEIYKSTYQGWYCTPCESFWTDLQLVEKKCPDCHRAVQELSEENYFFKLSKYQDWLIEYIQENPNFIQPEMRKNEMLGFLREPLEDLCITRPKSRLTWGIEYPGAEGHVIYVWFDALINYISAIKYGEDDESFKKNWPADIHVVGKDILRHHAVYWPIMLKACGIELPRKILAHGWWTMSGAKVSKSLGNSVDPEQLVESYGVDALRYFLLKEVTIGNDGAFSESLLRERYTTDLANDLGNLWFRVISMIGKYFDGELPEVSEKDLNYNVLKESMDLWPSVTSLMCDYDPRKSLEAIWNVITMANQFVEEQKPWVLAKDESKKKELAATMVVLAESLAHFAVILQAFLPNTANQIMIRLGLKCEKKWTHDSYRKLLLPGGLKIERGDALFPKLEDE